ATPDRGAHLESLLRRPNSDAGVSRPSFWYSRCTAWIGIGIGIVRESSASAAKCVAANDWPSDHAAVVTTFAF
ncbi:hypothetical protein, partial [Streptomyces roseolus]|uniref:hypothetical protein n=1 Tax=Streptomyces roseolus TaxID=67358 RepID=UPI003651081C